MVNVLTGEHEPNSELCFPNEHCFSCNKDEQIPPGGAYAICPECFHVYPKWWHLKWAYIKQAVRAYGYQKKHFHSSEGPGYPRILFRRTKNIYFCQECLHDF